MILHIVDDDETILDAMQFMLKGLNIDIKTWNSSHKFINEANLYEEGVVFLDIECPFLMDNKFTNIYAVAIVFYPLLL